MNIKINTMCKILRNKPSGNNYQTSDPLYWNQMSDCQPIKKPNFKISEEKNNGK